MFGFRIKRSFNRSFYLIVTFILSHNLSASPFLDGSGINNMADGLTGLLASSTQFSIEDEPIIAVNVSSISASLTFGEVYEETVYISNTGTSTLTWSLGVGPDQPLGTYEDLTFSEESGEIPPGDSHPLEIVMNANGTFTGQFDLALQIVSDDLENERIDLPVSFTVAAPAPPDSECGVALSLNGSTERIVIPDDNSLNLSDEGALETWVYLNSTKVIQRIIYKDDYELFYYDGTMRGVFYIDDNRIELRTYSPVSTNNWYHLVLTYYQGTVKLYLNGKEEDSAEIATSPGLIRTSDNPQVGIGSAPTGNIDGMNGRVAQLKIWNIGLSAEEVVTQMVKQAYFEKDGLVVFYDFSLADQSGYVLDLSDEGNDGIYESGDENLADNYIAADGSEKKSTIFSTLVFTTTSYTSDNDKTYTYSGFFQEYIPNDMECYDYHKINLIIAPANHIVTTEHNSEPIATLSNFYLETGVFEIVGGDDAEVFNIDEATGELMPIFDLDYENPIDESEGSNYEVTVRRRDGTLTEQRDLIIIVDNVEGDREYTIPTDLVLPFVFKIGLDFDDANEMVTITLDINGEEEGAIEWMAVGFGQTDMSGSYSIMVENDGSGQYVVSERILGDYDYGALTEAQDVSIVEQSFGSSSITFQRPYASVEGYVFDPLNTEIDYIWAYGSEVGSYHDDRDYGTINTPDDAPPVVTSAMNVDVLEGTNVEYQFEVEDINAIEFLDGELIDGDFFDINYEEGTVTFLESPDFENPLDENGDNVYELQILVRDMVDNLTTWDLTFTVIDVPNTWDGSSWSEGTPTSANDAKISGAYSVAIDGAFEANNLTIDEGFELAVNGENTVSVYGDLINNGSMIVSSGASLITFEGHSIADNIIFKRITRYADGKYSFVGTPIEEDATITGAELGTHVYKYDESASSSGEDLARWIDASSDALIPGQGYTQANQQVIEFVGTPNSGTITYSGTYVNDGYHLVSNPYPAAIHVDDFIDGNEDITGTIYIWDDNGSDTGRGSNSDYIVVTKTGATDNHGVDSEIRWNGHISAMQGFFVQMDGTAGTVGFTESMRVIGNNSDLNFFRQSKTSLPVVRVNLTSHAGLFKQAVIGWNDAVSDTELAKGYDGKVFSTSSENMLYTLKGDLALAIQTITSEKESVQLVYHVEEAGIYRIQFDLRQSQGQILYLRDNYTDQIVDLSFEEYEFQTSAGEFRDRFELISHARVLGIEVDEVKIYAHEQTIYIRLPENEEYTFQLLSLDGRLVMDQKLRQSAKIHTNLAPGLYIVTDGVQSHKILLK